VQQLPAERRIREWASSPRRVVLLALVLVSLACAPVSRVLDGVTPSMIVYPLVLLVGLWRFRRGGGSLFFAIAATIFLLVHLPFTWAAITDSGENPSNASRPYNPAEWIVTLFAVPLATAIAGFLAWRVSVPDCSRQRPALTAEASLRRAGALAVRYDVRVSDGSRFELERDEPLEVGGTLMQFTVAYRVTAIKPLSVEESDEFDAIAAVELMAGPAQAGFH
jgi:hypothetical protein